MRRLLRADDAALEPRELNGENVTATKHGFESRWGHQIVLVDVFGSGFEWPVGFAQPRRGPE